MRRIFTILFVTILLVCIKQGYDTYMSAMYVTQRMTGVLSDIAEEVVAIPLQPAAGKRIVKARYIREDGHNLFLLSEGSLYRFNRKGDFICRITNPECVEVAAYVVNSQEKQLIVLGNQNHVFYYTFDGQLLREKELDYSMDNQRFLSLAMYGDRILTVEENHLIDPDTQTIRVEKEVVSYSTSFEKIESYKMASVDLGRQSYLPICLDPQISVDPDTGCLYVYTPSMQPDYLLKDTLYLQTHWQETLYAAAKNRSIPVLPVHSSGRFLLSSYQRSTDESLHHSFCYDRRTRDYKQMTAGIKDDFYKTGTIASLEAMDLLNQSYCFCQSGENVKKAFPDRVDAENAVVFIARLKA
ncbi:hypothetical protein M2101_000695 [Parabacteroides sp. PM5-20]|uniref:6-bladed beta-propeller n=1 Tax=unclassified Parabacteroides TaxID=2649774 RepID=UPI0013D4CAB3|nr:MULTISPECIES: 6-bladed beta-propeller [unclassified Parabacteroides]MDH6534043.1 hypothetical protein [Parabacteroides sp. PM5-20]